MRARVSVKRAAEIRGKCEETIRRWCRTGKIEAVRPHGTRDWEIYEDSLFGALEPVVLEKKDAGEYWSDDPAIARALKARAVHTLFELSIFTIEDLAELDPKRLKYRQNCGEKTVKEILGAKQVAAAYRKVG